MAGHSKFHNIQHRKNAQDAKRAKRFSMALREISVATQTGSDPNHNSRLRRALSKAKALAVPKDKIQRAISGANKSEYFEITYSVHGPYGSAFIVETLTDNKNRMATQLRSILTKHNAKIESAEHLFQRVGRLHFATNDDRLLDLALTHKAKDIISANNQTQIIFDLENFNEACDAFAQHPDLIDDEVCWIPLFAQVFSGDHALKIHALVEALEAHEEIQKVFCNGSLAE